MKKYLFLSSAAVLLLTAGCDQKKLERLQSQQDSLMAVSSQKESNLTDFVTAFNEIEANLDSIKKMEMVINKSTKAGEVKGSQKEQIKSDIAYIYSLQVKNRKMLADLTAKLNKSNQKSAVMQKLVDNLKKSIGEKDTQIATLTGELESMNIKVQDLNLKVSNLDGTVGNLTAESQQKQKVIEEQTARMNTAYYVMGTNKELKDKKVITPSGGFIGIGRTKEVTADADMSNFTKVDITESKEISIMKKKVTVITPHPKSSYKIDGEDSADKLVILDPGQFWSLSKALVILIK